jgi:microcystin-dependent protein
MDQFLAEIRIFAGNFAPTGWALCHGQLMPISQNTALFSLLGTQYGGDGRSTFALPDLQDRVPMHAGQAPGFQEHFVGETGGVESVTLMNSELPQHNHPVLAGGPGESPSPAGRSWGTPAASRIEPMYAAPAGATTQMGPAFSGPNATPHNNMQPFLTLNFIIALQGIFPARG